MRILLATDAAREGIDLQRHCHRLIHSGDPVPLDRMEQRNGRIDRHGQQHHPLIYHFVGQGYQAAADRPRRAQCVGSGSRIPDARAAIKVNQIREDLGSARRGDCRPGEQGDAG